MIGPVGIQQYASQSDASYLRRKEVVELYKQMKDQNASATSKSASSAANLTSLCVDISPSLSNFFEVLYIGKLKVLNRRVPETFIDDALDRFRLHEIEKARQTKIPLLGADSARRGSLDSNAIRAEEVSSLQRSESSAASLCDASQDAKKEEHNRTMVLQVDRTDLRLISPDRKVILLHKNYKEVVACLQGIVNAEHFGFVSVDASNSQNYIGYIFKCNSTSICADTVAAINQAFASSESKPRTAITSCDQCPMIWFHKLCSEIENMTDRKTRAAILRRIESLDDDEQRTIMTKFNGVETDSLIEQNEFLMMLLRAHCEMKQTRHVHDTAENRSEFLNQYLGGGSAIFTKAKRSLSNSFEMLKKRASRDDFGATLRELNLPLNGAIRDPSPNQPETPDEREDPPPETTRRNSIKSPMIDMFFKVGSPKSPAPKDERSPKNDASSWRQAIFKRVVTPNKQETRKRDAAELRALWKKAINQAILLKRMERENAKLRVKQEESAVKRIKLEYDEMKANQRAPMQVWDLMTSKDRAMKCDRNILLQAIKEGVPRDKRGDVWTFLAKQYCLTIPPIDEEGFPNYNKPYESLLKDLTSHQHAILIDLGRTFPNHSYFSSPLGPGQLALFNLLKAYSLLDPEVGYCQGYSFIAGVLLLHMEESQAFFLFRHLMFRRDLRKQYLPDMTGLQIRLYQLSRLVFDRLPDLSEHFDQHDVSPTLYAAPWLLTMFSSQFPLGFVTRVFDLVFLEGLDVVFLVALSMLNHHKDRLLKCDNFEDIMNYLKDTVTKIDQPTMEKIMKQACTMDVSKKLIEYKVEYQVLQEEQLAVQPQVDLARKLERENARLIDENRRLLAQLEVARADAARAAAQRAVHLAEIKRKEAQNRTLEVSVATLGRFVCDHVEGGGDVPDDVRRIATQIAYVDEKRQRPAQNLMKMFDRKVTAERDLRNATEAEKTDVRNNNVIVEEDRFDNHPLSNCDVNFSFGGTKELRHLSARTVRSKSLAHN